jgi:hypothetical protein
VVLSPITTLFPSFAAVPIAGLELSQEDMGVNCIPGIEEIVNQNEFSETPACGLLGNTQYSSSPDPLHLPP